MTQQQFADAAGVSRQTINAVEAGRFVPSTVLALKIARTFGKPVETIFRLEEGDWIAPFERRSAPSKKAGTAFPASSPLSLSVRRTGPLTPASQYEPAAHRISSAAPIPSSRIHSISLSHRSAAPTRRIGPHTVPSDRPVASDSYCRSHDVPFEQPEKIVVRSRNPASYSACVKR